MSSASSPVRGAERDVVHRERSSGPYGTAPRSRRPRRPRPTTAGESQSMSELPVHQRQRRVVALLVEVVEAQHGQAGAGGEEGLAGAGRAGEQHDSGRYGGWELTGHQCEAFTGRAEDPAGRPWYRASHLNYPTCRPDYLASDAQDEADPMARHAAPQNRDRPARAGRRRDRGRRPRRGRGRPRRRGRRAGRRRAAHPAHVAGRVDPQAGLRR